MTRPRIALLLAVSVVLILVGARSVSAWGLGSICLKDGWVLANPESQTANTTAGDIAAGATRTIPEGVDTVTATWPGDQTPHTYTRPTGCHQKETPPSTSDSTSIPTSTSSSSSTSTMITTTSTTPPTTTPSSTSSEPSTNDGPTSTSGSPATPSAPAAALPQTGSTPLLAVIAGLCIAAGYGLRKAERRT